MRQQASLFFDRFHLVFAGMVAVALLMAISALVTAVGAHSVLDSKAGTPTSFTDTNIADNPNAITTATYWLSSGAQHVLLSTGTTLYNGCRAITTTTTRSGRALAHGSVAVGHSIGRGVSLAGHWVGNGTMATLRLPGHIVGSLGHGHTVSSIIRPADSKQVPVIPAATSAAALASLSAAQQQQISQLLAAQLTANRNLGGTIVAGDPNHGGYPARWDNARQDSLTDSWGMYSRECVSYAAWKVYQTYGTMPYWGGVGNASEWPRDARRANITTSSIPQVHSVAISMHGYYGHAMWVEKVSGDMIYVSQYNYDLHGHYSEMWINSSKLTYIYFK